MMHLEKENWLLAGQVRAAEGLVVEEEGTAYFEYLQ